MAIGYHGGVDSDFAHEMALAQGQETRHSATWRRLLASDLPALTPGGCCAYDTKRRRIWYTNAASPMHIRYIDVATRTRKQTLIASPAAESGPDAMTMRYDAQTDTLIVSAVREDGVTRLMWFDCAAPAEGWHVARTSNPLPSPRYPAAMPFDYVPDLKKYVLMATADKNGVYDFSVPAKSAVWPVERRPFANGAEISFAYVSGKRWSYVPKAKAFLWLPKAKGPLYAYRPYDALSSS
jgi:hypothetical protein